MLLHATSCHFQVRPAAQVASRSIFSLYAWRINTSRSASSLGSSSGCSSRKLRVSATLSFRWKSIPQNHQNVSKCGVELWFYHGDTYILYITIQQNKHITYFPSMARKMIEAILQVSGKGLVVWSAALGGCCEHFVLSGLLTFLDGTELLSTFLLRDVHSGLWVG